MSAVFVGAARLGAVRASNLAQFAAALAVCVAAAHRTKRSGFQWHRILVAGGAASWCAGQAAWTAAQWNGGPPPFPSVGDAGFLASYPLLIAAFLLSPMSAVRRGTVRAALDWTTVTSSIVFISWAAGLRAMLAASARDSALLLALSYPVLDICVLAVLVAVIGRCRQCRHSGALWMASGIGAIAVADSAFAYLGGFGRYGTGSLVDLGWIAGWLLVAVAVVTGRDDLPDEVAPVAAIDRAARWAPTVALVGVMITAVVLQLRHRPFTDDPLLFWLGLGIFGANVLRTTVALADSAAAADALGRQLRRYATTVARYDEALAAAGAMIWTWDEESNSLAWSPRDVWQSGLTRVEVEAFIACVHPEDRPLLQHAVEASVAGAPFDAVFRCDCGDGSERWIHASAWAKTTEDSGVLRVGLARDVTAERRAAERDARRLRETQSLARIGDAALRSDDVDVFLDETLRILTDALRAPLATILKLDRERELLDVVAEVGWREETVRGATVPVDARSPAGYTLACGEPVVVADFRSERRFTPPQFVLQHGVRSGMSAIIQTERGPWGVVGAYATTEDAFDDEDGLFLVAVANLVGVALDRANKISELRRRATYDDLTGLPNRALLSDRLNTAITEGRRAHRYTVVVHLDVNRFGLVNETYGHDAGDALLCDIARRLQDAAPTDATVARFGGDEFVVVAIRDSAEEGACLAAGLVAALQAPFVVGDPPEQVFLSASAGVALANGSGDADNLLRHAAAACAQADERGGGRYEIHDPKLRARALNRLAAERDIRRGLAAHEFEPLYQPIVDVETGNLVGAEVLARWRHPTRGLLTPDRFLEQVLGAGLGPQLGRAIMHRAMRDAGRWVLPARFDLAINVASQQLDEGDFTRDLDGALAATGFDAAHLVLEVVEDDFADIGVASAQLAAARQRFGVRVHIDDFGTGHSSLARLHTLPIDGLKIDRRFVARAPESRQDRAIVSTIIALGRSFSLDIIAEGVERPEHHRLLRELGCQRAQGWLYAPALPPDHIAKILLGSEPSWASVGVQ